MDEAGSPGSEERRRRQAVAAWHASGQPLRAWSEQTGQSYWALRRWRLKYAEELGIEIKRRGTRRIERGATVHETPNAFAGVVPVEIMHSASSSLSASTVEIRLRGARALIVSPSIDPMMLARLIGVVERAA